MRYKNQKKKKFFFLFKHYLFFFCVIIFFILGSFSERYNWKDNVKYFFNSTIQNIVSKFLYNFSEIDKIYIDIKLDNYKYLVSVRNDKLLQKYNSDNDKWTAIRISTNNKDKKINAKIKLKGQLDDHFKDDKKWSFKIKIDEKSNINNLTEFTLQPPNTLNFLNEWLFMKALEKKGLIFLKTDFVYLVVNGENFGIYTIQESTSKNTLETNKRRDGPIIGFDNDNWLNEVNNFHNNSVNSLEQTYFRSKIKPVRFNKSGDLETKSLIEKSIFLLDSFRKKKLRTSEVFDTDQMIDSLIIKALFAAVQYDWADMNFYYNPFTNLLEPILKEVHTIDKVEKHHNNWWLDSFSPIEELTQTDHFLNQIYSDQIFYEKYLTKLNKIVSEENYLNNLIQENKSKYNLYYYILRRHFPLDKIIGSQNLNVFNMQKQKIYDALNPKIFLNAYYLSKENNFLNININNLQRVPIKILGLKDEINNFEILLDSPKFIDGYKSVDQPPKDNILRIDCSLNNSNYCNFNNLDNLKIIFQLISQEHTKTQKIEKVFYDKKAEHSLDYINPKEIDFILYDKDKKIYKFKEGVWNIDRNVLFENNVKIEIPPNTEIIFSNSSRIISYSPIYFLGNKENPIKLSGNSIENKGSGGISILNTPEESVIRNIVANNLEGLIDNNGQVIFSGAITIYKSKVQIYDSYFSNNKLTDDYINIVDSIFEIKNVTVENSLFDAIDIDYSNGIIEGLQIINSGNDAIDFSVSDVSLSNVFLNKSGDKSISVGENSKINLFDVTIEKSNIGIATKDSSIINGQKIKIFNANIALASYIKKAIYDDPKLILIDSHISNSDINFLAENDNSIIFNGKNIKKTKFNYSQL